MQEPKMDKHQVFGVNILGAEFEPIDEMSSISIKKTAKQLLVLNQEETVSLPVESTW